jgi:hypothetical protein
VKRDGSGERMRRDPRLLLDLLLSARVGEGRGARFNT